MASDEKPALQEPAHQMEDQTAKFTGVKTYFPSALSIVKT